MRITISGEKSFDRFARACHAAAHRDWDVQIDRGLKEAGEDIGKAVHQSAPAYMPSGYELLFSSRLRTEVEVHRRPNHGVTVIAYAKGRTGRRDVEQKERGQLRHPIYGRYRVLKAGGRYAKKPENIRGPVYVNPWSVTSIPPGFFSKPVKATAEPAVHRRLDAAFQRTFDRIEAVS